MCVREECVPTESDGASNNDNNPSAVDIRPTTLIHYTNFGQRAAISAAPADEWRQREYKFLIRFDRVDDVCVCLCEAVMWTGYN